MTTITQLAQQMQYLFQTRANELAWETGFMERERLMTGSSFASGLVSAYQADSHVSLAGLSQAIGNAGTPLSRQAVHDRFNEKSVRFMQAMLAESVKLSIKGRHLKHPLLDHFQHVVLTDSTIITLPNQFADVWRGSGGNGDNPSCAAVKISVRWQLSDGELTTVHLSDGTAHDRTVLQDVAVEAGNLYVQDLGYFSLNMFKQWGQDGAYWLTRYKTGTIVMDQDGKPLDLQDWLPQQVGQRCEASVVVGQRAQLSCRLIAERVPPEVIAKRHKRIRETARINEQTPSQRRLALAHWTIYLTNTTAQQLTLDDILFIGRCRWQIECLFKLWKQGLHIDEWQTTHPHRLLCEIYAKLLAAIVTHWFFIVMCWHQWRRSLLQALPALKAFAWQWANSLDKRSLLQHAFRALQRALSRCQMDKSIQHPRHFQFWEAYYA